VENKVATPAAEFARIAGEGLFSTRAVVYLMVGVLEKSLTAKDVAQILEHVWSEGYNDGRAVKERSDA
jgi:hypothetical protein